MVLDMGEEDDVHLILGRPFLHTTNTIIYMKQWEIHFHFPREKVKRSRFSSKGKSTDMIYNVIVQRASHHIIKYQMIS
jgi:hypothetical protein